MTQNTDDNNQEGFEEDFGLEEDNFDTSEGENLVIESPKKSGSGSWIFVGLAVLGIAGYFGYKAYRSHPKALDASLAQLMPTNKKQIAVATPSPAPTAAPAEDEKQKRINQQFEKTKAAVMSPPPSVDTKKTSTATPTTAPPTPAETKAAALPADLAAQEAKVANMAKKNAEFENLKQKLFNNQDNQDKTVLNVPLSTQTTTATTTAAATPAPSSNRATAETPPATVAPQENTVSSAALGESLNQLKQLNQQLENNISQIQHLENALQNITQTVEKLNGDVHAMDNRLLALGSSTTALSSDLGSMKREMGYVKKALGDEGIDFNVPPPPSHMYTKVNNQRRMDTGSMNAYLVHAIIPGRAWLKAPNGQIVTVTEGDTLGDYGKVLVIDAASGMVLTNSGTTFH